MKAHRSILQKASLASAVIVGFGVAGTTAGANDAAPPGRSVAYAWTERHEAVYESKDKDGKEARLECPNGLNDNGIREQMAALFPEPAGKNYKLVDAHLAREAEIWFPNTEADKFPFHEVGGTTAYGLNLDGKVKPSDFTSPDGQVKGIDNQLYRAVGCIPSYREGSSQRLFYTQYLESRPFNRTVMELTDVDSLENDDDVTVTTYRGLHPLVRDAQGEFQADTTQLVDTAWGRDFVWASKAKIVNGVLITTKPNDLAWPNENHTNASIDRMREVRFEMKLAGEKIEGLMGGYFDIENTYHALIRRFDSHQISYGKLAAGSLYKVLHRLADGYPDPVTGKNTAISGALRVYGVRVHLIHPEKEVADAPQTGGPRPTQAAGGGE